MPIVDLAFKLVGTRVPVDHGYALYAAISRLVPAIHEAEEIGVHPIRGRYDGNGNLLLNPSSRLVLRMPDTAIPPFIKLAGKTIEVDGHRLTVGVPEIRLLKPAAALYARLVTIKKFLEPESFLAAATRQLDTEGIMANLRIGERRTFRVKDKQVVGFELLATNLDAESSMTLQEVGIGGRRHMGCGIFVPFRR
jgi:CRISPR-associated protein Cas6